MEVVAVSSSTVARRELVRLTNCLMDRRRGSLLDLEEADEVTSTGVSGAV